MSIQIGISNVVPANHDANWICKDLIDGWKLYYDEKISGPTKIAISGSILAWHYSTGNPDVRKVQEYTDTCELSQAQYDIWKSSKFEPLVLLLLLVSDDDGTDDYESVAWDFHTTDVDRLIGAIIPKCCACGSPEDALRSIDRVMSSFRGYPGGVADISVYDNGSDLVIAYQIDARDKFLNHGSSIGSSWLEAIGVIWSIAAMMVLGVNQRAYAETLPKLIDDISYGTLRAINETLMRITWIQYCIQEINAGTSTYVELWEEEGGHEETGTMWYIHVGNLTSKEAVSSLRDSIKLEYSELMGYCKTKTWADTKIVLRKLSEYTAKGLDLPFKGFT